MQLLGLLCIRGMVPEDTPLSYVEAAAAAAGPSSEEVEASLAAIDEGEGSKIPRAAAGGREADRTV